MDRNSLRFVVIVVLAVFFIAGCETVPKKTAEEASGVKAELSTPEPKMEAIQATGVSGEPQEAANIAGNLPVNPADHISQIQLCLKNAGFYAGKIDGIKGKATRKAIRQFQEANALAVDGIVGHKTEEALNKYKSGPVAAAQTSGGAADTTK